MSDREAIQGLWRRVAAVTRGEAEVNSPTTHVLFEQDRVKHICPSQVDGGQWATFELDPGRRPKRLMMTYESAGGNGRIERSVHRWLYDLDGDTLRLCWPSVSGHFPDSFSDGEHGVITLVRDSGPLPETKTASGKTPIDVPGLGALSWDDNRDWWQMRFDLTPGNAADLILLFEEEPPVVEIVQTATRCVEWLRANDAAARTFAAQKLVASCNASWNDGKPISVQQFVGRMALEGATRNADGSFELYYHDGGLFEGHCIWVTAGPGGELRDARLAG